MSSRVHCIKSLLFLWSRSRIAGKRQIDSIEREVPVTYLALITSSDVYEIQATATCNIHLPNIRTTEASHDGFRIRYSNTKAQKAAYKA